MNRFTKTLLVLLCPILVFVGCAYVSPNPAETRQAVQTDIADLRASAELIPDEEQRKKVSEYLDKAQAGVNMIPQEESVTWGDVGVVAAQSAGYGGYIPLAISLLNIWRRRKT